MHIYEDLLTLLLKFFLKKKVIFLLTFHLASMISKESNQI